MTDEADIDTRADTLFRRCMLQLDEVHGTHDPDQVLALARNAAAGDPALLEALGRVREKYSEKADH